MANKTNTVKWPDLTVDTRAWELAKTALGADAPVSDLAQRAQEIKNALLAETPTK